MRHKYIFLALMAALTLSFAACKSGEDPCCDGPTVPQIFTSKIDIDVRIEATATCPDGTSAYGYIDLKVTVVGTGTTKADADADAQKKAADAKAAAKVEAEAKAKANCPAAPNCTYSAQTNFSFDYHGRTETIVVSPNNPACPACTTIPTGLPSWITIVSRGDGSFTVTITENKGAATRTVTFILCGVVITISQGPAPAEEPCIYAFPPTTPTLPAAGESSVGIGFTASRPGCAWSAAITTNPGDMLFNMTPTSGYTAANGTGGGQGEVSLNKRPNTGAGRDAVITWTTPSGVYYTRIPQDAAPGK